VRSLQLRADLLYVIVLGPGFGESILVRVPPASWLVVDSFRRQADAAVPTLQWLAHFNVQEAAVAVTHPHLDHVEGLPEVLRQVRSGPLGCSARVVADLVPPADAEAIYREGAKRAALMAVRDRWEAEPARKWELVAGSTQSIGDAQLTVLYPTEDALERPHASPNRLASPFWIEWHSFRALLGSDLDHAGWVEIAPGSPALRSHHVYKVAHHGSKSNQHHEVVTGNPPRAWAVTPWMRGGHVLPRLEDDEGIDRLLEDNSEGAVTCLPLDARRRQAVWRTRAQALAELRGEDILGSFAREDPTPAEQEGGWMALGFDRDGLLQHRQEGPSAVVITRNSPAMKKKPRRKTKDH